MHTTATPVPSRTVAAIRRLQFLGIDELTAPFALDTEELEEIGDLAVVAMMVQS